MVEKVSLLIIYYVYAPIYGLFRSFTSFQSIFDCNKTFILNTLLQFSYFLLSFFAPVYVHVTLINHIGWQMYPGVDSTRFNSHRIDSLVSFSFFFHLPLCFAVLSIKMNKAKKQRQKHKCCYEMTFCSISVDFVTRTCWLLSSMLLLYIFFFFLVFVIFHFLSFALLNS